MVTVKKLNMNLILTTMLYLIHIGGCIVDDFLLSSSDLVKVLNL